MGDRTVAFSQHADLHSLTESSDTATYKATVSKESSFAKLNPNKRKRDEAARLVDSNNYFADGSKDEVLFPQKLFAVLEDAENDGFTEVVSWGQDGTAFRVHQKREFENSILPKYFKMTKYKSFTRQLHNYGFIWIRKGPEKGGCKKTTIFLVLLFFKTVFLTLGILLQR
jgi:hypothetical protein